MTSESFKPKLDENFFWPFPEETQVRELPPTKISILERRRFKLTLKRGETAQVTKDEDLYLNIGLDMGTSSTKVVVRLPYESGEPTIAIPAPPSCRSGEDPYLWQTVLWIQPNGTFLPWPEPKARLLHTIKQGLIHSSTGSYTLGEQKNESLASRDQTGVAYLAFVIRYVKGWLKRNRSNIFNNREPVWYVNVGMPAASYNEHQLVSTYRRIGMAGLILSMSNFNITVESTQNALLEARKSLSNIANKTNYEAPVSVVPEAAAEMAAFAKSSRSAPGLYLLIDIGAMTLDASMVKLSQNKQNAQNSTYAFLNADVKPLGVESFHWFKNIGKTEQDFIQQCNRMLKRVILNTKQRKDPYADEWKRNQDLPYFLAGGGAENNLHRKVVSSLGPWMQQNSENDGLRPIKLPTPKTLDLPFESFDFSRMAVAWGLSFPAEDIGKIIPLNEITDVPVRTRTNWRDNYISKDQM